MFESDQYELLDFGDGEKLERFAGTLVRRDCPAANRRKAHSQIWNQRCLSFSRDSKQGWRNLDLLPDDWTLDWNGIRLMLQPTPFGHLGVFAEQAQNWEWIRQGKWDLDGLQAINLFAYTGATTLALAGAGAAVTHVDSARTVVQWARQNAAASGLGEAPIRWIVDDVLSYLGREIKRGKQYDIVIADPPSFGHGVKRQGWKIERDMTELLRRLAVLTQGETRLALVTGHSIGRGPVDLADEVAREFGLERSQLITGEMNLETVAGSRLSSGYYVRFGC